MDYKKIFDEAYQKETNTTQLFIDMEMMALYSRAKIKPREVKETIGRLLEKDNSKDLREVALEAIKELERQKKLESDGKQEEVIPMDISWKQGDNSAKMVEDFVEKTEKRGR